MQVKGLHVAEWDQGKESRLQAEALLAAELSQENEGRLQAELRDVCEREKISWVECQDLETCCDGQGQQTVTEIVLFTVAQIVKFQE